MGELHNTLDTHLYGASYGIRGTIAVLGNNKNKQEKIDKPLPV